MPYEDHPRSINISDSETVWRVMNFYQFMALLEYHRIFFCRLDKFSDEFEGTYPRRITENIVNINLPNADEELEINDEVIRDYGELIPNQELEESEMAEYRERAKLEKNRAFANCWYVNNVESDSLWDKFSKGNGIAVQSTIGNLKSCLDDEKKRIYMFKVRYIDYTREAMDSDDFRWAFCPFIYKRREREHEKELRLLILSNDTSEVTGLNIQVDLETLIQKLIVAPGTESWVIDLINRILERYNLPKPIVKSSMDSKPY